MPRTRMADSSFPVTSHSTGDLDAEQRQRLIEIAEKCPVHKTLVGEIAISYHVMSDQDPGVNQRDA